MDEAPPPSLLSYCQTLPGSFLFHNYLTQQQNQPRGLSRAIYNTLGVWGRSCLSALTQRPKSLQR